MLVGGSTSTSLRCSEGPLCTSHMPVPLVDGLFSSLDCSKVSLWRPSQSTPKTSNSSSDIDVMSMGMGSQVPLMFLVQARCVTKPNQQLVSSGVSSDLND